MNGDNALDAIWRKSSYSHAADNCVEVGAVPWRKATYSHAANNCVEAGNLHGAVLVRDTKDGGQGPVLRVTRGDWARFTASGLD
ncbi:MAG TPA: DUF397 domain-containing protein [Trebonia sp.]|jgi:hypothetical protein|nr:DUF397 domain-containing protein [Trebonia sp.]